MGIYPANAEVMIWAVQGKRYLVVACRSHNQKSVLAWTSPDGKRLSPALLCPLGCPLGEWDAYQEMQAELDSYKDRFRAVLI